MSNLKLIWCILVVPHSSPNWLCDVTALSSIFFRHTSDSHQSKCPFTEYNAINEPPDQVTTVCLTWSTWCAFLLVSRLDQVESCPSWHGARSRWKREWEKKVSLNLKGEWEKIWIPWNLSFRYIPCNGQFTPKMKANAEPRLLSSLVWIDSCVVVSQHRLESIFMK